jgi:hypothetical protein
VPVARAGRFHSFIGERQAIGDDALLRRVVARVGDRSAGIVGAVTADIDHPAMRRTASVDSNRMASSTPAPMAVWPRKERGATLIASAKARAEASSLITVQLSTVFTWKSVANGADASGLFRRKLTRAKLMAFFASQPRGLMALEVCGGAHYWGRQIGKRGHIARLIPPAYVAFPLRAAGGWLPV